jgi:starch-binding outer membrane protein, SusD/RagB family
VTFDKVKKRLIKFFFILTILISLTSCKKWLDERQNDSLAVPTSLKDLQALLDDKANLNEKITPSMLEASADDYFLLQPEYNVLSANKSRIAPYSWDTNPFNIENDWKVCYYPVYVANLCLQQVDKIRRTDFNALEWDNVKGSSYFLRAYFYLELLWNYSKAYDEATADVDLGIVLRLTADVNDNSIRSNVKQSYLQVLNDAKNAINFLPNQSIHCLRPSKAGAYGLLARTFLSMRQYDSAFKYADLSLQIYNELIDFNHDSDIVSDFSTFTPPFKKYNKEIVFYTMMNFLHGSYLPTYAKVDTVLYSSYKPTDLRKKAFFRAQNNYYSFKGTYAFALESQFTGIATDELWLIRAECLARKGDKDAALFNLNELLGKRYANIGFIAVTANNSKEALDIILNERRKELLMRGLRWMDLKRYNKEGANISLKRIINGQSVILPPNDNRYAQPIPEEIINLTGMPQNPR